ncbi:hypothetical protein [Nitrosomonas sp. Nm58]|jgi:hypothetical protein|uniref:hypothetical protein n=1 Tax=Nitrosomonas sp. Nm58 TaxID=200126 RepID=UPI00089B9F7F|nr:hypothetical protein [Nitrosomonas sp. Nm58]SDY53864.1 hypothetical protein SAMN05421754_101256 [Nitrosomonas sp. Nm58]
MNQDDQYVAIVLAANRTPNDPVTNKTDSTCKAFVPVGGKPMIIRGLNALAASDKVKSTISCGPFKALLPKYSELTKHIERGQVIWMENQDSPSRSAEQSFTRVHEDSRKLVSFWRRAKEQHKRSCLIAQALGWKAVLSYLFGYLIQAQALKNISTKTGVRGQAITLPFPQVGIDVNKVNDWLLVESHLEKY